MNRPPIPALALGFVLTLTLAGCASPPFDLGDNEWQSLSVAQKVELRWRWIALHHNPPAAVLSLAPNGNATAALIEVNQRNLDLTRQLEESRRTIARLEEQVAAARSQHP